MAEELFLDAQRTGQWGLEGAGVDVVLPQSVLQASLQQAILLIHFWQGLFNFVGTSGLKKKKEDNLGTVSRAVYWQESECF